MRDEIDAVDSKLLEALAKIKHLAEFCQSRSGNMNCKDCTADEASKKSCLQYVEDGLAEVYINIIDHIYAQESLMKEWLFEHHHAEHYQSHVEAHASISEQFHSLISSISHQSPADVIKQLLTFMHEVLERHQAVHDKHFSGLVISSS